MAEPGFQVAPFLQGARQAYEMILMGFEKGDIDIARNLGSEELDAVSKNPDVKVDNGAKGTLYYLGLNQKNPNLAKPEVREALKWLVDYQAIADTIMKNRVKVHQAFLPEGFLGAVNRFEGEAEGTVLHIGEQQLRHGGSLQAQGRVLAFARPHELQILTDSQAHGLPATVDRVLSFGAAARVELSGPNGQHLEAELTREQAAQLQLQPGQRVQLQASRLSLFEAA